jgi:hypothetical protein
MEKTILFKICGTTLRSSVTGNNVPVLVGRFGGQKCFQSPNWLKLRGNPEMNENGQKS